MRKKSIIILAILMAVNYATASVPSNDNPPECESKEKKAPARRPIIDFNDSVVSVWSPYIISGAEVIIRNDVGDVLYQETIEEFDFTYTIQLSEEESAEVYSIELVYGDQHLTMYVD